MKKGITLVEILVAIALFLIIIGIILVSFSDLNNTNILDTTVAGTVSSLAEARSKHWLQKMMLNMVYTSIQMK